MTTQQLVEREAVTGSRSFDQLEVIGLDGDAVTVTNPVESAGACRATGAMTPRSADRDLRDRATERVVLGAQVVRSQLQQLDEHMRGT